MSDIDEVDAEKLAEIEAMFVQTAGAVRCADGELLLDGCSPSTLYFSDRPQRIVGHLHTAEFVNLWTEGDNSFAADPPNAVLAFIDDDTAEDVVVVIRDPRLEDGTLRYAIEVLEGQAPASAGPCTLFIDPFGRPLSPVSVAGINRRSRRRARRRF